MKATPQNSHQEPAKAPNVSENKYKPPQKTICSAIFLTAPPSCNWPSIQNCPGCPSTQPAHNVTVTVDPDEQSQVNSSGKGNSTDLTFTTSTWNTAQTVTVTAIDDLFEEGTYSSVITHTASSPDANYDPISVRNVVAAITDNDRLGDITSDGSIDIYDLQAFVLQWLAQSCEPDIWCAGADLTGIAGKITSPGEVTLADFAILADNWLQ